MAYLTHCGICGDKVSSDAKSCPHCGDPRTTQRDRINMATAEKQWEQTMTWKKAGLCSKCGSSQFEERVRGGEYPSATSYCAVCNTQIRSRP